MWYDMKVFAWASCGGCFLGAHAEGVRSLISNTDCFRYYRMSHVCFKDKDIDDLLLMPVTELAWLLAKHL